MVVMIRALAMSLALLLLVAVSAEATSRLDSATSSLDFNSATSRVVDRTAQVLAANEEQGVEEFRKIQDDASSVYEKLEAFGFPAGLLPHTVVDYSLESDGKFTLKLNRTCSAMLQGTYLLTYQSEISGRVSYHSIKSLKGVSVRAFFIDWSISGIRVSHNDLVFEVGIASAKFPISNFDESPQCEREDADFQISSS